MRDVGGQHDSPATLLPGKNKVPNLLEARWAAGPVWMARKISPPPGFNPRTIQPLANRYSDYAIPVLAKLIYHSWEWTCEPYRCMWAINHIMYRAKSDSVYG
jgi:hypothetical protein